MIGFLIQFLIFLIVVTILIIGFKYLLSLTGIAIPQPILIIAGLILFLVLLLVFLSYAGGLPSGGWPVYHH